MAKKGKRPDVHLKCTECSRLNYLTNRSVINTPKKLELKKFCRHCRKHTLHKEARVVRAKK